MNEIANLLTHKKLVLIKQVYLAAEIQSRSIGSTLNRLQAVIGFDWANESLLKLIYAEYGGDPKSKNVRYHDQLLDEVNNNLVSHGIGPSPHRAKVNKVHLDRNASQHEGRVPSETEVDECRIYTRDFLTWATQTVWGVALEQLQLVDLIQSSNCKQYIIDAEEKRRRDLLGEAATYAAAALKHASFEAGAIAISLQRTYSHRSLLALDGWSYATGGVVSEDHLQQGRIVADDYVLSALDQIVNMTILSMAGVEYRNYIKLRNLVGEVTILANGSPVANQNLLSVSRDDADFAISFATDAIIRIEETIASMEPHS